MEKKPHVCWIDIPVDDLERSKKFYSGLFGWQIEKDQKVVPDSPANNYFMISSRDDENHPHFLGGLIKRMHPGHKITIYINVPSLDESMRQVKSLGGRVISEVKSVPGWGYFVICNDPESNMFALWEPNKEAK